MLIGLEIYLIAAIFEVRYLFKQREKKEAVLYLCITALTIAICVYVLRTPKFTSFARMMIELLHIQ